MKIAHLSDLHIYSSLNASWTSFLNKRATGYANFKFRRASHHKEAYVVKLLERIKTLSIDHLFITGDLSNLALDSEFAHIKDILSAHCILPKENISIIPGNHDSFTKGSFLKGRFAKYFSDYMKSDIEGYSHSLEMGSFPFIKVREPYLIIGLSSAIPALPFVAAGKFGVSQRESIARLLAHPKYKDFTPLFLGHHPLHPPVSDIKKRIESLHDSNEFQAIINRDAYYFHGHLHRRMHIALKNESSTISSYGATSASFEHEKLSRIAGFNLYEFSGKGNLLSAKAHTLDPKFPLSSKWLEQEIPHDAVW